MTSAAVRLRELLERRGIGVDLVMAHADDETLSVFLTSGQDAEAALGTIQRLADVVAAAASSAGARVIDVRLRDGV